ncbi:sigma-E processing peptidase SpoIIGA [Bhargavaea cecembensis]|uniref:sigma-E processing peptidase SpoIIGA n=2 Tax=Bhargavaea cecembensis TaxID=394098 RepID=UPI00058E7CD7|nr:sigma-E processing peptidase SpoIIGA [Bhargavaea cecembensis]
MYGEVAIAVNSAFNYVLLSFAGKVSKRPCRRPRILFAALAGALPVVLLGANPVIVAGAFAVMALAAFGANRNALWKGAGATIVAALFAGGLLTVLSPGGLGIPGAVAAMLSCGMAMGGLRLLERRWSGAEEDAVSASFRADTVLHLFGSAVPLTTFADSGNGCTEPLSGEPVHFISLRAVRNHLPDGLMTALASQKPGDMPDLRRIPEEYRRRLRPVRITTVGGSEWAVGFKIGKWDFTEDGGEIRGYFVLTAGDAEYPLGADAILHRTSIKKHERG